MPGTLFKVVDLDSITLTDGLNTQRRLPSENLWTALQLRLTATSANGPPASVLLDGILNLIARMILRVNGRPIFNLPAADQYFRQTYQWGTAGNITQATTTVGATNVDIVIPLALPRPAKYPESLITGLPAGLINNITLELQAPAGLIAAVFGTPGTTSFSAGPSVQISAHQIEASQSELRDMLRSGALQGYIQTHRQTTVAGAGDLDQELDSGRGRMLDLYSRVINNSALSDALVTNVSLLVGTNSRPIESRHLVLQDTAKRDYQIETSPVGTWAYAFNRFGKADQYVDLDNVNNVKLRYTCGAPTGTANIRTIQGTVQPDFYREVANLQ